VREIDAAAAASSTVGAAPPWATSVRAAAISSLRVRVFWRVRPDCSYGVDMA
jgi:hypothetical protein